MVKGDLADDSDGNGLNKALIMASVEAAGRLEGAKESVTRLLEVLRESIEGRGDPSKLESDDMRPADILFSWTMSSSQSMTTQDRRACRSLGPGPTRERSRSSSPATPDISCAAGKGGLN